MNVGCLPNGLKTKRNFNTSTDAGVAKSLEVFAGCVNLLHPNRNPYATAIPNPMNVRYVYDRASATGTCNQGVFAVQVTYKSQIPIRITGHAYRHDTQRSGTIIQA